MVSDMNIAPEGKEINNFTNIFTKKVNFWYFLTKIITEICEKNTGENLLHFFASVFRFIRCLCLPDSMVR